MFLFRDDIQMTELMYDGRHKSSQSHQERSFMAEDFCCANTLALFMQLEIQIQLSILISVLLRLIQR